MKSSSVLSRRVLLQMGGLGCFYPGWLASTQAMPIKAPAHGKPIQSCILLFMWGGPSHIDTWDLKPNAPAEVRGEFQPIATTVPGLQISEHFPRLAKLAHHYTVIRSMSHTDPAHLSPTHHLLTGRLAPKVNSDADPPSRKDWPHIGSVLAKLQPGTQAIPPFVAVPWTVSHPAAPGGMAPGQNGGWMGSAYDPFTVSGDPNSSQFTVNGLRLGDGVALDRLASRRTLLQEMEQMAPSFLRTGFSDLQDKTFDLLASSKAQEVFDLTREPDRLRDAYGRNTHGQSVLLARRLVEAGVRFVQVNWHNDGQAFWDTHGQNFRRLKTTLMPMADQAFATLIQDLDQRSLLDQTLVVWVGEFGRAPKITPNNAGREHWPGCYSAVLTGGGIPGGRIYGASDKQATAPTTDPVSPADLAATMLWRFGIEPDTEFHDKTNRPWKVMEGQPLRQLF